MEWLTPAMRVVSKLGIFMGLVAIVAVVFVALLGLAARFGNQDPKREWVNHEKHAFKAGEFVVLTAACWAALTYGVDLVRGSAWWAAMLGDDQAAAISAPEGGEATGFLLILGGLILVWVFLGMIGLRRSNRPIIINPRRTEKPTREDVGATGGLDDGLTIRRWRYLMDR